MDIWKIISKSASRIGVNEWIGLDTQPPPSSWYKLYSRAVRNLHVVSNGLTTDVIEGPDGTSYFCISGNTFPVKQQLSGVGFRWNAERKCWFMHLSKFQSDTRVQSMLQGLGVSAPAPPSGLGHPGLGHPGLGQPSSKPGFGQPNPGSQPNAIPGSPIIDKKWFLAKKSDDSVIAMALSGGKWEFVDESGNSGPLENPDPAQFQPVNDAQGKQISGKDPATLFRLYKQTNPENSPASPKSGVGPEMDENGKVRGRIPENMISPNQKAIQDSFLGTNQNQMINALAGTGKTSTLRHLASFKDPNEKWLYLVFNKKNQIESSTGKGKFPNNVEVLTSHAFLGRVLGKSSEMGVMPGTNLWSEPGDRMSALLDAELEYDQTFPPNLKYAAKKVIKQIASLAKANAVNPFHDNTEDLIRQVVAQYSIDTDLSTDKIRSDTDYTPQLIQMALGLLNYSIPGNAPSRKFEGSRDHDDTLWYSAINSNVSWPSYDVVLADEVQDFNSCQTIMLHKLAEAGARIVAVGDPAQSLYMFRGADANAFNNVQHVVGSTPNGNAMHDLPVNYRSGRKIIDYVNQNTHVKGLVAGRDFDGKVTEGTKYEDVVAGLSGEKVGTNRLAMPTAMIARTNAPLVSAALDLLKNGIDFAIMGRDFSKELIDCVERVLGKGKYARRVPIDNLPDEINRFVSGLESKWRGKISKAAEMKELSDTANSVNNVIMYLAGNNYTDPNVNMKVGDSVEFINYLRQRFAGVNMESVEESEKHQKKDPHSYVTLTSAHRSKGLEFDRVFILEPNLFPHPKAKSQAALQQEENAKYVAFTRAMKELHVLASSEQKK